MKAKQWIAIGVVTSGVVVLAAFAGAPSTRNIPDNGGGWCGIPRAESIGH